MAVRKTMYHSNLGILEHSLGYVPFAHLRNHRWQSIVVVEFGDDAQVADRADVVGSVWGWCCRSVGS